MVAVRKDRLAGTLAPPSKVAVFDHTRLNP